MAAYRRQLIVERQIDKELGHVEVLACGHVYRLAKHQIAEHVVGKVEQHLWTRQCRQCAKEEGVE